MLSEHIRFSRFYFDTVRCSAKLFRIYRDTGKVHFRTGYNICWKLKRAPAYSDRAGTKVTKNTHSKKTRFYIASKYFTFPIIWISSVYKKTFAKLSGYWIFFPPPQDRWIFYFVQNQHFNILLASPPMDPSPVESVTFSLKIVLKFQLILWKKSAAIPFCRKHFRAERNVYILYLYNATPNQYL